MNTRLIIDHEGPTWTLVLSYLVDRLSALQKRLEQDVEPIETASLRGRISELRRLIKSVEAGAAELEPEPDTTVPFI